MWIMTVYLFLTKHWFASLKMSISKFLFVVNKSMFSQGNKYEDSCLILPQESVYVWMWFSEYKYFAFKNDLQHKSNTVQKKKKVTISTWEKNKKSSNAWTWERGCKSKHVRHWSATYMPLVICQKCTIAH